MLNGLRFFNLINFAVLNFGAKPFVIAVFDEIINIYSGKQNADG